MQSIKGKWTAPEVRLHRALRARGDLSVRTHVALPGKPDFVVRGRRVQRLRKWAVAVFLEGCFFHGCGRHYKRPKSNRAFWDRKLRDNVARDRRNRRRLRYLGYSVLRVWEHRVRTAKTAEVTADAIANKVKAITY